MAVCFKSNKNEATLLGTIMIFLNIASCFGGSNLFIPIAGIIISILLVLSISSQSSCLIIVCVVFQCIQIVIYAAVSLQYVWFFNASKFSFICWGMVHGFLLISFLSSGSGMSNKLSLPILVIFLGNSNLYFKISLLVIIL